MADSHSQQLDIADVYAESLFDIASERGTIDQVRDELQGLVELASSDPAASALFASQALDDDERDRLYETSLRGRISDELLNTLLVMNRNGRVGLLQPLLQRFIARQRQAAGEVYGAVRSATPLDDAQRAEITQLAAQLSGLKPVLTFIEEPELLGGLIVQVGDVRFDNSIRTQLEAAREKLAARSEVGFDLRVEI